MAPLIVAAANENGLFVADDESPVSVIDLWRFFRNTPTEQQTSLLNAASPLTQYGIIGPADTLYWRTPTASLASVVDSAHKGAIGDQQRMWRATLGNGSVSVTTTYPGVFGKCGIAFVCEPANFIQTTCATEIKRVSAHFNVFPLVCRLVASKSP